MFKPGRLCVKIAGRDATKKCVVVEKIDNSFVIIDGETRRRKCNIKHLEPLKETLSISAKADHNTVVAEFKKIGIEIVELKSRPKKEKAKQIRAADRKKAKAKEAPAKKATAKPAAKKETKPSVEEKVEATSEKPAKTEAPKTE